MKRALTSKNKNGLSKTWSSTRSDRERGGMRGNERVDRHRSGAFGSTRRGEQEQLCTSHPAGQEVEMGGCPSNTEGGFESENWSDSSIAIAASDSAGTHPYVLVHNFNSCLAHGAVQCATGHQHTCS